MKIIVDSDQRFAKMRAHTATHLLHAELAKIFPKTKQEGSLVESDSLRFDFSAERLLTLQEIITIEKNINQSIYSALPVIITENTMEEAIKLGAKAFFEDKYGERVRVVQVKNRDQNISIELCGGTHVENTKEIGCFAIISQETVASGIKRISAYTGPKVSQHLQEVQNILDIVVQKLGIKTSTQLIDKLEKVLKEYEEMKSKLESMQAQIIIQELKNYQSPSNEVFDKVINISKNQILKTVNFKDIINYAKSIFTKEDVMLYTLEGGYAIITSKTDSSAKIIAQNFGLMGGGSETLFQGKDLKVLELFGK